MVSSTSWAKLLALFVGEERARPGERFAIEVLEGLAAKPGAMLS
jgi:hypothetical protein